MKMNTRRGITAEKPVRQAIAYAIDRNWIIKNLMKDHASTMYGPIHPLTWAYTDDVERYDYSPQKARELLDAAGWKVGRDGIRERNGQRLKLSLMFPNVGNPIRQATAPAVQQFLKDVGIEVELQGVDWPILLDKTFDQHDYDMFFVGWSVGNEPDPTGLWDKASAALGGNNASGFWTDRSEELIKQGKATNDILERMEIYHEFQQIFADEMPVYIFYAVNTLLGHNERLQNFKPGPWGYLWNVEELWLSK